MCLLADHQIKDLASMVTDECGCLLMDDQLTENIFQLLENIAGFEQNQVGGDGVDRLVHEIKRHYYEQNGQENGIHETTKCRRIRKGDYSRQYSFQKARDDKG